MTCAHHDDKNTVIAQVKASGEGKEISPTGRAVTINHFGA
jgi:hypothetical protein